jgi:hypothetical protein
MGDAGVDLLDAVPADLFCQRSLLGHVAFSSFSVSPVFWYKTRQTLAKTSPPTGKPADTPVDRL